MNRVKILGPLRGLAAFGVLWFHLTRVQTNLDHDGMIGASGAYGYLGVEVFFVISGFIIPWSLYASHYQPRTDWARFILKRLVRLDPPYLASIAGTLLVAWMASRAPGYRGGPVHVTWPQLFAHLGYANAVLHYDWFNPVYWTLAIEAMFYTLVAWAYPYLGRPHWGAYIAIGLAPLIVSDPRWIFLYLPVFGMGIATFQYRAALIGRSVFCILICSFAAITTFAISWPATIAGLSAVLAIVFLPSWEWKPLTFLGTISYSLYLVHVPVGGRVVNLGNRFAHDLITEYAVLGAAIAASLLAAWALWRVAELPAQRVSSAIRFRRKPTQIELSAPDDIGPLTLSAPPGQ